MKKVICLTILLAVVLLSSPVFALSVTSSKTLDAFILCPTRELCIQIARDIEEFTKHSKNKMFEIKTSFTKKLNMMLKQVKQKLVSLL